MPGAEARRKEPKYRKYKRVSAAESYARGLGVEIVEYGGRIDIANVCNHGLLVCQNRGVPMPTAIRVQPMSTHTDEVILAAYAPSLLGGVGSITINGNAAEWERIAEVARERREDQDISTGDERHFVVHELGELVVDQHAGFDNANVLGERYAAVEEEFQREDLDHIYAVLGNRATHNHGEFVAECFTALMLGRADELHQDEAIMKVYKKYGGNGIRQYDEGLSS
jgi:hypothetical protein